MILSLLLFFIAWPGVNTRRVKRIAQGEPVPSVQTYQTYFFVTLETHRCGGSLVHPEFVLSAAHCLLYYEVVLKETSDYLGFKNFGIDSMPERLDLEWYDDHAKAKMDYLWAYVRNHGSIITRTFGQFPAHVTYTNYVLFAGGVKYQGDKSSTFQQKRHIISVFPYEKTPVVNVADIAGVTDFRQIVSSIHDIALVRACLPFDITQGNVKLAPFDRSEAALKEQFSRIVSNGMVCLYVGFGSSSLYEDDPRVESNQMLFTWRSTECSTKCYRPSSANFHNCVLCSKHHGPKLGALSEGDSGGPVICEGRYAGVILRSDYVIGRNFTRGAAYPVQCAYKYMTPEKIKFYQEKPDAGYHHPRKPRRLTTLHRA